jgi:hypothetical protein
MIAEIAAPPISSNKEIVSRNRDCGVMREIDITKIQILFTEDSFKAR